MVVPVFDKINEYDAVRISLASPEDIRKRSYGEVKKPETINYRTYRAEKDGLFCERIFGPERNWECFCGKYKGIKHKGVICDRCGVKVTHSRVRRKRMGHINLAAPVVHIWFFKAMPSRLGALLGMKTSDLEKVIYFQDYVVVDKGNTPLKDYQLLTDVEYREARKEYKNEFVADMGAEAIKKILQRLEIDRLAKELRVELQETGSQQKAKDLVKRLDIVDAFNGSENKPEWMVLESIAVIPPDLRPLVLLESGNFATSDLNDLFRRIINRNNRLKKLTTLNAPEVIIRNEKRMLQQSVDALFDNSRGKRPVMGSNNRPLKSLTDMIKGKQGRFRENLLGKRVDYSARSVIVVGPELKLHQCGLPKKIALELFQPFIIKQLKEKGLADTIKSAKKMLAKKDEEVWDILEEVVHKHPVLLNRAPTLHRMGIQAFEPVLVDGHAIKLHPLVCRGFNADFDGDQMAVHLPLSVEAQVEAITLMLSINNIFSPASGEPIISPSQDIILGCYYLSITPNKIEDYKKLMIFGSVDEVMLAFEHRKVVLHTLVTIRLWAGKKVVGDMLNTDKDKEGYCTTTVGRILFNNVLPVEMLFYNMTLNQKEINNIIYDCYKILGRSATIKLLDDVKELGFKECTKAGLSISISDLNRPKNKAEILSKTEGEVSKIQKLYQKGIITEGERYNQIIDTWTYATEMVAEDMMVELRDDTRNGQQYLNPVYMMSASGARGSAQQLKQLSGMRGLMAKPSGKIIEAPIKASFREGLKVLEYFSSTHGARKGLADTALKTADSGYLTRKLADVAQNVVIMADDCGTLNGIAKSTIYSGERIEVPLHKSITGRVALDNIVDLIKDEKIVLQNEIITVEKAKRIEELGYEKILVRSPLTCEIPKGLCAKCYGMDLSRNKLVEIGIAAGIIAAQSIGEPGTQLTMKTFHIGGTATRSIEEAEIKVKRAGIVQFSNLNVVKNANDESVVLNTSGEIIVADSKGREIDKYSVPLGAIVMVEEGSKIAQHKRIVKWDPHMVPILAEMPGIVRFEDVVEGKTMRFEADSATGVKRKVIIEHKGDLHPQVILEDKDHKILGLYPIPEKAHIEVDDGEVIDFAGTLLAKTPREISRTEDITGGLPRVAEIFESRIPKYAAVMSEISGVVELGEKRRGKRSIIIKSDTGMEMEHLIPRGKHLKVHRGDYVKAGDALIEGPLVLQDILRISGEDALQKYMLKEVQNVYRTQNVRIDDKHIEIIISRILRKVKVVEIGDTRFLPNTIVDKFEFKEENNKAIQQNKKPAVAKPLLLGITKASLQSNSFISAASFQETTKVLTKAALEGKRDMLEGLKENVILGHLIPAGTGLQEYHSLQIKKTGSIEKIPADDSLKDVESSNEDKEKSIGSV